MPNARDETQRPTIVFLPAMLCNEELYHPQIEAFRDLVEPMVLTVAEATMAEAAAVVLQQAPPRFCLSEPHTEGVSRWRSLSESLRASQGRGGRGADGDDYLRGRTSRGRGSEQFPSYGAASRPWDIPSTEHAEIGALIPAARVVVLEECGHLPTLERPDATVALAREWLDQLGVKAGAQRRAG